MKSLTDREREVLKMLAEGKSVKQIAAALDFSVKTADAHRYNLTKKIGTHGLAELIFYALRNGIIEAPESEHHRPIPRYVFVSLARCGHAQSCYADAGQQDLAENILGDLRTNQLSVRRITLEDWKTHFAKNLLCGCKDSGL
jgi:DNA-binding CsgD family transcriptional regulator